MRESFTTVDVLGKKPKNDSRSFEEWYLSLLFRIASEAEAGETQNERDYFSRTMVENFNQSFLGWESISPDSPLDFIAMRSQSCPFRNAEGRSHGKDLMNLMARWPEIQNVFGLSYQDLRNMTFADTGRLRKILVEKYTKQPQDTNLKEKVEK